MSGISLDIDEVMMDDQVSVETPVLPITPDEIVPATEQTLALPTATPQEPAAEKFDAADQKLASVPGVKIVSFGQKVSRFPIDRARFSQGKKALIALISPHAIVLKTHYNEELKSYLCFEGDCCNKEGLPNVRYLFPVFVYDTNDKGQPVSKEVQLKILAVGDERYENLIDIASVLAAQGQTITRFDLLVTCADEQFQKLTFTQSTPNLWRKFDPAKMKELLAKWKENKHVAYQPIAKSLDIKTWRRLMGMSESEGLDASELSLDDLLE